MDTLVVGSRQPYYSSSFKAKKPSNSPATVKTAHSLPKEAQQYGNFDRAELSGIYHFERKDEITITYYRVVSLEESALRREFFQKWNELIRWQTGIANFMTHDQSVNFHTRSTRQFFANLQNDRPDLFQVYLSFHHVIDAIKNDDFSMVGWHLPGFTREDWFAAMGSDWHRWFDSQTIEVLMSIANSSNAARVTLNQA